MNRLAEETSPYLRQHRDNPVDWYPWGDEAFARARELDRPVLLSVGYSACHWCHVMAHECFEDPGLAQLQNQLFVSVKVDREERPDVDRVYMDFLQATTGQGGWPMTVFLLPDGRPFLAGTYFPPEDRGGLPGFGRVMRSVAQAFVEQRRELERSAEQVRAALTAGRAPDGAGGRGGWLELAQEAGSRLAEQEDRLHGGFGTAPKFPQAPALELLLAMAARGRAPQLGAVALRALDAMAAGGIRDQLEGGFHRYSVDQRWGVPHFEKMLYDQAQLIRLYLHGWQLTGEARHLAVARSTADFMLAELSLPGGGFAASLDADSGEGEGAFYTFGTEELSSELGPGWREQMESLGLDPAARTSEGRWVLQGGSQGGPEPRERLRQLRRLRPRPERDGKLLVGWNALAISALAELSTAAPEGGYREAAEAAAGAVLGQAREGGRLRHLFDGQRARFDAGLEDLAGMGAAALDLHEAEGSARWYQLALEFAGMVQQDYADAETGGWFDTPRDHDPNLSLRPRTPEDNPYPSGQSLMVSLCFRLWALSGDDAWRGRCESALAGMRSGLERFPAAFGTAAACALNLGLGALELALVSPEPRGHAALLRAARRGLRGNLVVGVGVAGGDGLCGEGPPLVVGRGLLDGADTAYLCRDFSCELPVSSEAALEAQLDAVR